MANYRLEDLLPPVSPQPRPNYLHEAMARAEAAQMARQGSKMAPQMVDNPPPAITSLGQMPGSQGVQNRPQLTEKQMAEMLQALLRQNRDPR